MKRGILVLSLFLISILVISGCGQLSNLFNRCWDDLDCARDEYCDIGRDGKVGICKSIPPILNNTMIEGCVYGIAFEDEFNIIFCFANNSLQPGYFGTINSDPLGEDGNSWKPRLLNNNFTVFILRKRIKYK